MVAPVPNKSPCEVLQVNFKLLPVATAVTFDDTPIFIGFGETIIFVKENAALPEFGGEPASAE